MRLVSISNREILRLMAITQIGLQERKRYGIVDHGLDPRFAQMLRKTITLFMANYKQMPNRIAILRNMWQFQSLNIH